MRYLFALLIAVPLSAQQTVVVPDVSVVVEPPAITNEIIIMSDSVMLARIAEAVEGIRADLTAQECDACGSTSNVVRVGQGGLVILALWMAISLNKIANKETIHNIDVNSPDVNVEVHEHTDPPHDDDSPEDSESRGL